MTLKIEKVFAGRKTVFRLTGRLQSEHLDELKAQLEGDWQSAKHFCKASR
jgi:hypothetical protein